MKPVNKKEGYAVMKFVQTCLLLLVLLVLTASQAMAADFALEGSFKIGPAIIMIVIICVFISVGLMNRASGTSDYYAAGRSISRVGSGMAIASNWMSAASYLGMPAIMYGSGYHGLAYVMGFTGGFVLLLVLMASQIRRFGKYTAPDFIGDRYTPRACAPPPLFWVSSSPFATAWGSSAASA